MYETNSLIGKTFGKLKVLSRAKSIKGSLRYNCVCDCSKNTIVYKQSLIRDNGTKSCGCLKKNHFVDLTGKQFGNFTILKLIGQNKWKCWIYLVKCICGKEIVQEGNDVKSGKISSCGCERNKWQIDRVKENPYHILENNVYADYRKKAEYRGYNFELTFEEVKKLIHNPCFYCGILATNIKSTSRTLGINVNLAYNGIDRIDNNKGYISSNVTSCCKICNQAKHQMTQEFFYDWVKRISKNLIERDELDRLRQEIVDAKAAEKDNGWSDI